MPMILWMSKITDRVFVINFKLLRMLPLDPFLTDYFLVTKSVGNFDVYNQDQIQILNSPHPKGVR